VSREHRVLRYPDLLASAKRTLGADALAAEPGRRWDLTFLRTLVNAGEQCTEPRIRSDKRVELRPILPSPTAPIVAAPSPAASYPATPTQTAGGHEPILQDQLGLMGRFTQIMSEQLALLSGSRVDPAGSALRPASAFQPPMAAQPAPPTVPEEGTQLRGRQAVSR
jgi:hypothetical protein